jgi:hypothetical protein
MRGRAVLELQGSGVRQADRAAHAKVETERACIAAILAAAAKVTADAAS